MTPPRPVVEPLHGLLLLLSVTTGMVDAISVLGLDKVFTANMTGNVVFLGFVLGGAPGFDLPPYVIALGAFLMGALVAGRLGARATGGRLRHWLVLIALIEAGLLWAGAGAAWAAGQGLIAPDMARNAIIALSAAAMGLRNATIRRLKVPDLTTTVLTLTLTGLAADSRLAGGDDPNWGRRVASVLAILGGAALGARLVTDWGLAPPLLLAGALGLAGTLALALHPAGDRPVGGAA